MTKVSIIIPTYNEEEDIEDCLRSLNRQSLRDLEIIVVDDGSTDRTLEILKDFQNIKLFKQPHKGTAEARNLGAKKASGDILVFVDADMTFDKRFLENLVKPIITGKAQGTFSKEEYVKNKDNVWSKCWNINKGLPQERMHPVNYPDTQPVFRAILKNEFERVGGFESIGYIDDYTLSEKLGYQARLAPNSTFYHKNPSSLKEVFKQARWVGKSEYKRRKIKNENLMRIAAILRYSLPVSILKGIYLAHKKNTPQFFIFKLIYDLAIEISLIGSFFGVHNYK